MMTTRSCAASLACCRWRAPLARAASCLGERPTRPNSGHLCRPPPRCRWLLAAASVVAPPSSLRPGATRHVCNARRKKHDSQKWAPVREGENASRSARDADAPHVQWHHNARCVCPCSRRSSATVRPGSARPQNVSPSAAPARVQHSHLCRREARRSRLGLDSLALVELEQQRLTANPEQQEQRCGCHTRQPNGDCPAALAVRPRLVRRQQRKVPLRGHRAATRVQAPPQAARVRSAERWVGRQARVNCPLPCHVASRDKGSQREGKTVAVRTRVGLPDARA